VLFGIILSTICTSDSEKLIEKRFSAPFIWFIVLFCFLLVQVYRKLKNKPSLVQVLSNYIKGTQKSNQDTVGMAFTFNDLQDATETLRLVLLNNPHLSSAQFSHVLDLYQVDFFAELNTGLEKIIQDTYSISCSKGIFLMLSSIKDQLSVEHSVEGCKSIGRTEDTCLDTCAKLLWGEIGNLMESK
jgi:hypothetical protein